VATVNHMRLTMVLRIQVPFGHFVLEPHYHPEGVIELTMSSELTIDPAHPLHLMGADGVFARTHLEDMLHERVAGRMFVWDQELEAARTLDLQHPAGVVVPPLVETIWTTRPTIEGIAMYVALLCAETVHHTDPNARLEEVRLFETERTGCILRGDELTESLEMARKLFG
jgi:hypothetical protein